MAKERACRRCGAATCADVVGDAIADAIGREQRVLNKDASVCGKDKPTAFEKLRALLVMHYVVRDRVADRLGQNEAVAIGAEILAHLKGRIGDQLGGTPGAA